MLAQSCTWAKQSKNGAKAHCRKVIGWGPNEGDAGRPSALAEFRIFMNQHREENPHLDYRSAQQSASAAWHAQRGTVKGGKKSSSASRRQNPLYGQQKGGFHPYFQYGGVDYISPSDYKKHWNRINRELYIAGTKIRDRSEEEFHMQFPEENLDKFIIDLEQAADGKPISATAFKLAHAMWYGDGFIDPNIFSDDPEVVKDAVQRIEPGISVEDFLDSYLSQVQ